MGEPHAASRGSQIIGYDEKGDLATIAINFDGEAENHTLLQY